MKHILFYITNYPGYGGIEKVTTYLANALCKLNYKVSILSFHCGAEELLIDLDESINCIFVPNQENKICDENARFIANIIDKNEYDRIIYQDCYSPIHELLFQTSYPCNNKLIVVEHNSPTCHLISYKNYWNKLSFFTLKGFVRKIAYPYKVYNLFHKIRIRHKKLLDSTYKYVLLSDKFKSEIHFLVGNKYDDKILSIPNPVTLPSTEYNNSFNKENKIVFIGRLVEDKGIDYLLQIWDNIEKISSDWSLSIIGDGPLRKKIEEFIHNRKLTRIELCGAKADVSPFLSEASILMMTSIFEGWGLVLTEAMSRGCVPIAFGSFASITDIIDDNINGYIIPPYQIDTYTDCLLRLISNPQLISDISKQSIRKSQKFTIDKVVKLWDNILK